MLPTRFIMLSSALLLFGCHSSEFIPADPSFSKSLENSPESLLSASSLKTRTPYRGSTACVVSPTSIKFTKVFGQPNPSSQNLQIVSSGVYSTHDTIMFMDIPAAYISGVGPRTIPLNPSGGMSSAAVGTYQDKIEVNCGSSGARVEVPVTLVVNPVPNRCGDRIKTSTEACDDGNILASDGCSANCTIETGYICTNSSPSVCTLNPVTPPPPPPSPLPLPSTGWPNASNTGYQPTGVTLGAYSGPSSITADGTSIDGKDLGCLIIYAKNVSIRRSRIRCGGLIDIKNTASVVIEDTEIDGMGEDGLLVAGYNYTFRRVNLHSSVDGARGGGNVTIEDSYFHDFVYHDGAHNDAVEAASGSNFLYRHNTIEMPLSQTSAMFIAPWDRNTTLSDVTVENNLLSGGGFTIYAGGGDGYVSNLKFINNRFTRKFFPNSGYYGPVAYRRDGTPGYVWSGNVWHDTGLPVE